MALKLSKIFKGIELPDAYHKITLTNISEQGSDEEGKLYKITICVNSYTNETKEYDLEQQHYTFNGYRESDIKFNKLYTDLKQNENFEGAIDI